MAESPSVVMRIYREDYDRVEAYRAHRGLRRWIEALHEMISLAHQTSTTKPRKLKPKK